MYLTTYSKLQYENLNNFNKMSVQIELLEEYSNNRIFHWLGVIDDKRLNDSTKKGFDFTQTLSPISTDPHFFFGSPLKQVNTNALNADKASTNPFIFGESSNDSPCQVAKRERKDGKISVLPKWLKGDDEKR